MENLPIKNNYNISKTVFEYSNTDLMRTDIYDFGSYYEMRIEMPDVLKEDISLSLNDGYLILSADFNKHPSYERHIKVIRKERYEGIYERKYSVGLDVKEEDINAKLENGLLILKINKHNMQELPLKYIEIE